MNGSLARRTWVLQNSPLVSSVRPASGEECSRSPALEYFHVRDSADLARIPAWIVSGCAVDDVSEDLAKMGTPEVVLFIGAFEPSESDKSPYQTQRYAPDIVQVVGLVSI